MLIALARGPRHGYALIDDVAELTGGTLRLGPATLYRSLQRMRVQGWIREVESDPASDVNTAAVGGTGDYDHRADRRRSYVLTSSGRSAAQSELLQAQRLLHAAAVAGLQIQQPGE